MSFAPEPPTAPSPFRICFVCSGNICRSPIAEVVFRELAEDAGLGDRVEISSAGTGDWHVGEQADPRAVDVLHTHGYDGSMHRARQFDPAWFDHLDLVVALDRSHERILKAWATNDIDRSKVQLLRSFETPRSDSLDVPDPYYSDHTLFAAVLGMIERASRALLAQLAPALRQPAQSQSAQSQSTQSQSAQSQPTQSQPTQSRPTPGQPPQAQG